MKLPASQALYAYWLSLCQGRRAPERDDLDPVAMRHMLAQTFVLDVDAGLPELRNLPVRLSGTRLDALFGRDLKGSDFVELWAEADRRLVRGIANDVLDDVRPAILGGCAGPAGAPQLGFELLLLPLRHLGRTHARLLGGLAFASTPTWLGLQAARPLVATTWRMLEGTPPSAGTEGSDGRRAHLVVYEGGRSAVPAETPGPQARVKPVLSQWMNRR